MQVPLSPMSVGNLQSAIEKIRQTGESREKFIELLIQFENEIQKTTDINVREEITGPIVDELFRHGEVITREIDGGLKFQCAYTSKIVRDFIMSLEKMPEHVWEPQTTRLLLDLTQNAENVIIGGAFFGDHAIPIANQLRDHGTVHAFELSQQNSDFLQKNADMNHLSNIKIIRQGLWSNDQVELTLEGDDSHASPRVKKHGEFGYTTQTVDNYRKLLHLRKVDLIMLDIEGGEFEALKGSEKCLCLPPAEAPIIVFEVHRSYVDWSNGIQNTDIIIYLVSKNYQIFALRDYNSNVNMRGMPIELIELDEIILDGPPHGFNMVAVKDRTIFDTPLYRFRKNVSPKLLRHRRTPIHNP